MLPFECSSANPFRGPDYRWEGAAICVSLAID
jgi:hypothetical protein